MGWKAGDEAADDAAELGCDGEALRWKGCTDDLLCSRPPLLLASFLMAPLNRAARL